ncbi:hypothetical protein BDQ17DRAFT_1366652 [Cyathus striatus]|nr:hypothetical protein BDQ17DRAFT_1366652 [Cyathus striatus]
MVKWTDPANILLQSLALVKTIHFLDGFFFWQFFSTLSFEVDFLRGKRDQEWPLALYVACRFVTAVTVASQLVGINITSEINCIAWNRIVVLFSYLGVTLASGLFISQIYSVWQHRAAAVVLPIALTLTTFGMMLYEVSRAQSVWSPTNYSCASVNTAATRNTTILTLVAYFSIFVSYTVGVFVNAEALSKYTRSTYQRAILWVFLPFVMQTLPVTFISLNLNDAMNLMFQVPALITTVSCATEMYREICDAVAPRAGKHSLAIGASYFGAQNTNLVANTSRDGIPLTSLDQSDSHAGADSQLSKVGKTQRLT